MKIFKQYLLFFFLGFIIAIIDFRLCKLEIFAFLKSNIFNILITVIALNLTAVIFLFTRLTDEYKGIFNDTIEEIHFSIKEQIVIIPIALIATLLHNDIMSLKIISSVSLEDIRRIVVYTIFVFTIYSIWDITEATFLYIKYLNQN